MPEPSWEEWVAQFNAPAANTGAAAPLAAGPGTDVLSGANRANIAQLFDPNFGRSETMTRAAEDAVGGGWGAGSFAANQGRRLLDSERKANFTLGAELLEPYLQREQESALQSAAERARLNEIAAEGAQALQRLQLSEAGETARLSTREAAALQRAILDGQQAMQRLVLSEAGQTGRQQEQIRGSLAQTLLAGLINKDVSGGGGTTRSRGTGFAGSPITAEDSGIPSGIYPTDVRGNVVYPGPTARWGAPGYARAAAEEALNPTLGSASIDQLLRKYGLIV